MNKYIHYGLVLFVIASICAGALAFANTKTAPIILERMTQMELEARTIVMPMADEFRDTESIVVDDLNFIPAYRDRGKIGYVVAIVARGYGGDINIMLGIGQDAKVEGLNIISAQETPGLGDRILNREWQDSWKGRDKDYRFSKEVDGFAGATVSPMAVYTAVNRTLESYIEKVVD